MKMETSENKYGEGAFAGKENSWTVGIFSCLHVPPLKASATLLRSCHVSPWASAKSLLFSLIFNSLTLMGFYSLIN
ncbi:Uncharacterized protein TCM_016112 [Theobroma cacao]|uniref:Uncharacterized protein n=1 Tax=Theobroma cacao TaxID=3641 RepID=A0A061G3T3_THECC|nr:Uncharacterized protein TCM_016112 [Theobroma cacao]